MRATLILPVLVLLTVGVVVTASQTAGSSAAGSLTAKDPGEKLTLQQAVTRPYAKAGTPDPVQAAVNAGRLKQAPGVRMNKVTEQEGLAAANKVLTQSAQTAGCTAGYGSNGSCLPVVSPSAAKMGGMFMPWTCQEVRSILPGGIALTIKNVDPQHLDTNHDGTACGTGD